MTNSSTPRSLYGVKSEAEVIIGDQLRALREQQNLSQGDIEKRTGLLRGYVSRVENGRSIPTKATIHRLRNRLKPWRSGRVPLTCCCIRFLPLKIGNSDLWGSEGKDAHYLSQLRRMLSRTRERDRQLLLQMARRLARGANAKGNPPHGGMHDAYR